mmetsp:Transcript_47301/g.112407  ORF Transcript_47301/g.112407 Transcript_47301/m.112407 type:complete len:243 (+) Transcript_47301:1644-2372(+)
MLHHGVNHLHLLRPQGAGHAPVYAPKMVLRLPGHLRAAHCICGHVFVQHRQLPLEKPERDPDRAARSFSRLHALLHELRSMELGHPGPGAAARHDAAAVPPAQPHLRGPQGGDRQGRTGGPGLQRHGLAQRSTHADLCGGSGLRHAGSPDHPAGGHLFCLLPDLLHLPVRVRRDPEAGSGRPLLAPTAEARPAGHVPVHRRHDWATAEPGPQHRPWHPLCLECDFHGLLVLHLPQQVPLAAA